MKRIAAEHVTTVPSRHHPHSKAQITALWPGWPSSEFASSTIALSSGRTNRGLGWTSLKKNTQTYAPGVISKTSHQTFTQKSWGSPAHAGIQSIWKQCSLRIAWLDNFAVERFAISTRHVLNDDHEAELETQPCLPLLGLKTASVSWNTLGFPSSTRKFRFPVHLETGQRSENRGEHFPSTQFRH